MRKTLFSLGAASLLVLGLVSSAEAAAPERVRATPSQACEILVEWHAGGYSSFDNCMETFNQDVAAYRFFSPIDGTLISLDENCSILEAGISIPGGPTLQITYPFSFEEGPGWPFPVLYAQNHHQCEITLFTYHKLAGL
jgi:hypothetical protein